ncbi:MAG: DUF72 domain-containing protein [Candidatus Korarchaeota archaeon]|nr:DUF72 domain-containing protein [Thermoproteota archaeon]
MILYVGTSGWNYFWNKGGSLEWYIENVEFNAIELNMSFYRFPHASLPKSWARRGRTLAWAIKVNQLITHRCRFGEKAFDLWKKFRSLFEPMEKEGIIKFYLFQCPPSLRPTVTAVERLEKFIQETSLGDTFAIEFRNKEWFNQKWEKWLRNLGATMVSVDAPDFVNQVFKTTNKLYMRLHGRTAWYSHVYSEEELLEIFVKVREKISPSDEVYFFLNNNHGMLPTGELIIRVAKKHMPELEYRRI